MSFGGSILGDDITFQATSGGVTKSFTQQYYGMVLGMGSSPTITGLPRAGSTLDVDLGPVVNVDAVNWYVKGMMGGYKRQKVSDQGAFIVPAGAMEVCARLRSSNGTVHLTPPIRIFMDHSMTSHNEMDNAALALMPHSSRTDIASQDGDWSDPTTWQKGVVPAEGARVLIPLGLTVQYDIATSPRLDDVRIDGTLNWSLTQSTHLHVETILVPVGGRMIIGTGFGAGRLPVEHVAEIIFSDRCYRIDPNSPSDLDFTNDPTLLSRGLIVQGLLRTFGHHRTSHFKIANDQSPMAGDDFITCAEAPEGLQAGDTIVVPMDRTDFVGGGTAGQQVLTEDEEMTVSNVVGNVINFTSALQYDHRIRATAVTDRPDLQTACFVKDRNIILRSESKEELWHRAHSMVMHGAAQSDVWDTAFLDMGRTDKTQRMGAIIGTEFFYLDIDPPNSIDLPAKLSEPATARSNAQARYSFHFHMMGFDRPLSERPRIHDCYAEDNPGWMYVHHGCQADEVGCVGYKFTGSCFVAESGNETGAWVDNFAHGCIHPNASSENPKVLDGARARRGDRGRNGYAYYMTGRAVRLNRNGAGAVPVAFVFFHRDDGSAVSLSAAKPLVRAYTDQYGLAPTSSSNLDKLSHQHQPISHFVDNWTFGARTGFSVTKPTNGQRHDVNILLSTFTATNVETGGIVEYIGNYILNDWDIICRDKGGNRFGIIIGPQSNQVTVNRPAIRNARNSIELMQDTKFSVEADWSQSNPQFIIVTPDIRDVSNGNDDIIYQNATVQANTRVLTIEPAYLDRPSHDIPFIIADWSSTNLLFNQGVSNIQSGQKTDSLVDGTGVAQPQDLPKVWDAMIFPVRRASAIHTNGTGNATNVYDAIAARDGYWTYGADKIVILGWEHVSDRFTGKYIKTLHAVRATGSGVDAYTNNGVFSFSSAPPVRSDMVVNTTKNTPVDILPLVGATSADSTVTLDLERQPSGKLIRRDPHQGEIEESGGVITYMPDRGFIGTDTMTLGIADGKGRVTTFDVAVQVAA